MESLWDLFHTIYDVEGLVRVGGLMALIVIVFAETGLLIGFFLPGDSLLVTAGLFAVSGHLELWSLFLFVSLAAIVGDAVGYFIGVRSGPRIFSREDSLLFHKKTPHHDPRVLRSAWRYHYRPRPVHADPPHLCARRRGGR